MRKISLALGLCASLGPAAAAAAPTCTEMLGQMIITSPFPPPRQNEPIDPKIGGVLFTYESLKNLHSVAEVGKFVHQFRTKGRYLSFDQEGGLVQRLNDSRGFQAIPKAKDIKSAREAAYWGGMAARDLVAVGANMNFSTVVDLCVKGSPVIDRLGRCYSEDPDTVAEEGLANALGNSFYGVVPVFKHFPGHGSSRQDSHKGVAVVNKTMAQLRQEDMKPYERLLSGEFEKRDLAQQEKWNEKRAAKGKAPLPVRERQAAVMVGHLNFPNIPSLGDLPADLNPKVVNGWLRHDMGFQGLVISDDLGAMKAITSRYTREQSAELAIKAGIDLVMISNQTGSEKFADANDQEKFLRTVCKDAAADKSKILSRRIAESYARIQANKVAYGLIDKPIPNPAVDSLPLKDFRKAAAQDRLGAKPAAPGGPAKGSDAPGN